MFCQHCTGTAERTHDVLVIFEPAKKKMQGCHSARHNTGQWNTCIHSRLLEHCFNAELFSVAAFKLSAVRSCKTYKICLDGRFSITFLFSGGWTFSFWTLHEQRFRGYSRHIFNKEEGGNLTCDLHQPQDRLIFPCQCVWAAARLNPPTLSVESRGARSRPCQSKPSEDEWPPAFCSPLLFRKTTLKYYSAAPKYVRLNRYLCWATHKRHKHWSTLRAQSRMFFEFSEILL